MLTRLFLYSGLITCSVIGLRGSRGFAGLSEHPFDAGGVMTYRLLLLLFLGPGSFLLVPLSGWTLFFSRGQPFFFLLLLFDMIPSFEQHCPVGGANLARWTVETKSGKWVCGRGFMSAMRDGLSYFSFLSRWNGTEYE
jgi:hypothetical protein